MKLKLKNTNAAAAGAPASAPTNGASQPSAVAGTSSAPKLALKFKPVALSAGEPAAGPVGDAPKPKRKYTKKAKVDDSGQPLPATKPGPKPKKRPLEDVEESAPAKRKVKPTMKSLSNAYIGDSDDDDEGATVPVISAIQRAKVVRQNSIKISLKKNDAGSTRPATAILKVKGAGRPPPRPPGVGYDSEAEEAEEDPAIESQFVLRMAPGLDNDLLRKSIDEKTIGKSQSTGGPGVQFRFFDREGRKAMITIQGRMYAATMVELPCVIESLKSWNKKDWVKTADVCQMLLVLGRVNSEEEAKKFTRPREIEPDSHRYPHGLTPPMRYVRKRRFRPRKSYLDVERIETATEELLQADENADDTKYDLIDSDAESSSGEGSEDEDAQGEDEEMMEVDYIETPVAEQVDVDDLMEMFDQEHDNQVQVEASGNVDDLFGDGAEIEVETPVTGGAHEVAMHALTQHGNIVLEPDSAASTPAAATSPDDDDDDDDGDDDDDEDDPEAAARQREIEQKRIEIRELDGMIEEYKARLANTPNVLYKKRLQVQIDQLVKDKQVKMSGIGETDED